MRQRLRPSRRVLGTCLSIVPGDTPPSEFRIFTAGAVETTKGQFTFDDAAAKSVMSEYEAHGADVMLDYDHASLGTGQAPDPATAGKAAGWCNLEVRNGELWAVNVRWTDPAAAALARKEWRYISPAFTCDESGHITSLMNVAITNMPATRRLEPLMAASANAQENGMTLEEFLKVVKALGLDPSMPLEDVLAKLKGEPAPNEDDAAEDAPDSKDDITDPDDPLEKPAVAAKPEDKEAMMAVTSMLSRMTGKSAAAAILNDVETWRTSHVTLAAEQAKLAKERAAMEMATRRENAATLTKLGAETPHTTGLSKGKLCKRLLDEPLDEQTARVAALLAARGGKLPAPITAAMSSDASGEPGLTPAQIALCKEYGTDPAVFAKLQRTRDSARNGG